LYYQIDAIKEFIKGIKFYSKDENKQPLKYIIQLGSCLFALTYAILISISIFSLISLIIIFGFKMDIRQLINDDQLNRYLCIYIALIISIISSISIKNTLSTMKSIENKSFIQSNVWILFMLAYIIYASVFIYLAVN